MEKIAVYEQIVIEIETEEPVDLAQFQTCYKNYLSTELTKVEKEMKYNQFRKIRFLFIGTVFIVLSALFQNQLHTIILELLSIIGSFAIWEMTNLILVGNRELKSSKLNLKRELQTKIRLKEK